jgi:6-phosphogluconolactonase
MNRAAPKRDARHQGAASPGVRAGGVSVPGGAPSGATASGGYAPGGAPGATLPGATPQLPLVAIYPDVDTLALATATLIVAEARRAVKARGRFTLALAGGSTPRPVYELLARQPFVDLVPWREVQVFWGDERCAPPDDPRSNEGMARDAFLNHVPIPADHIHPMRCAGDGPDGHGATGFEAEEIARRAAQEYELLLRSLFAPEGSNGAPCPADAADAAGAGLDLVLLGLGEDGHTASLFPDAGVLRERERWVAAVYAAAAPGPWRITLTAPFLNRAALVVFLVTGSAKAAILQEVLGEAGDGSPFPAWLIRPKSGMLRWHVDDEAAALLSPRGRRDERRHGRRGGKQLPCEGAPG